jgi:GntR family transcriptional regulator, transcriptional repressor for pyruvate dehydrogenase complex
VLRVSNALLGRIVSGAYPAGLRLPPEVALSGELGCARGTLREALRHLAGLGVVKSRRGSGVMVLDFRREGTLSLLPAYLAEGRFDRPLEAVASELLYIRKMLAVEAARLSATHATPQLLAPAKKLAKKLPTLEGDTVAHTLCELEMYRELLHASQMWPVVWFANAFWEPLRQLHEQMTAAVGVVPPVHGPMLDTLFALIERHEAQRASDLVRAHFDAVDEQILPTLSALLSFTSATSATSGKSGASCP